MGLKRGKPMEVSVAVQPMYLFSWLSPKDLAYAEGEQESSQFSAFMNDARAGDYARVILLYDKKLEIAGFQTWYAEKEAEGWPPCDYHPRKITNHQSYKDLYNVARALVEQYSEVRRAYLVSGGSKAMGLVWVLLNANARYEGQMLNSYRLDGGDQVEEIQLPFEINVTFLADFMTRQTLADFSLDEVAFEKFLSSSQTRVNMLLKAQLGAKALIPVHIHGETGSGKEEMAKALARVARGPKAKVVSVNCSAIPENLLESQLFGHKRGSFTGADHDHDGYFLQANGGTLFLDEIGDMNFEGQTRLLRVLQEKEVTRVGDKEPVPVDVYLISATHKSLLEMVKNGDFREDLYYRLVVWPVYMPPMRAWTPEDRAKLIRALWRDIDDDLGKRLFERKGRKHLPKEVVAALGKQPWPGNVRQLGNALKRLYVLSGIGPVTPGLLDEALGVPTPDRALPGAPFNLEERLEKIKDGWILEAYRQEGSWEKAAAYLGMPSSTLHTYRKKRKM